jgi:predicted ribosome quality control (RQC) complex YloA/Tae2 family protein
MGLLEGAVVRRADVAATVAAVEVRSPGETCVIVLAAWGSVRGIGIVSSEAQRAIWGGRLPPGAARRKEITLEGARVLGLTLAAVHFSVGPKDAAETRVLALESTGIALRPWPGGSELADEASRAVWEARGEQIARAAAVEALASAKAELARAIDKARGRIERRAKAMQGDLARTTDADALAEKGRWLLAEAARAPRGAKVLTAVDWTSGEPQTIEIPLDPSKPARDQVEAMFHRARRLKRGAAIAAERIAQADAAIRELARVTEAVVLAPSLEALAPLASAARAAAPRDFSFDLTAGTEPGAAKARAKRPGEKGPPFRTFRTKGDARILVGKGAAQNDALTLHVARPHDLWLHAKGVAGAHVIVPLDKGRTCPGDLLVDAAHLAAHFSDARGEAVAEIEYVEKRHVRKPKGSAPGLVIVQRSKVLVLRLEQPRVTALLEREEIAPTARA